jgi:hypothetical protein
MTTAVVPDLRPDPPERDEWPTLDRNPAHTTHEQPDPHSFDPTQGRQIGSNPRDDATQGRQIGSNPHDDPTRAR